MFLIEEFMNVWNPFFVAITPGKL